jgi:tripartite-type tricarboxylate transporter receptor subunit TctC
MAETAGLQDFTVTFWQGMVVPADTPKAIVERLEQGIAKVALDPEVIEHFKPQGVKIRASTQAQLREFMTSEETRWVRLIKERSIKAE